MFMPRFQLHLFCGKPALNQFKVMEFRKIQVFAFLTATVPEPEFIEPENWTPNSPDVNPIDYLIWGALQQLVCRQKIRDLHRLKEMLTSSWEKIGHDLIQKAIDQWLIRISLIM